MDPPVPGRPPPPLPVFSFSSWDRGVYVVERAPQGGGCLKGERAGQFILL